MSPLLAVGVSIVFLALICYSAGVISEQRSRIVSKRTALFLVFGVTFDVTATICMILVSEDDVLSLHGLIGFSSLAGMLTDVILAVRHRVQYGDGRVPRWFHLYSRFAYSWWIIAFITGALLVALKPVSEF